MKKVKMLTIVFAIILVTIVAVLGIYIPKQNRMENIVKEYSYGMDLKGGRVITLKPDTSNKTVIKDSEGKQVENATNLSDEELTAKGYTKEEVAYNSSDVLTEENYEKSKRILEERFKSLNIENYEIRLDKQSGNMTITIPENDSTDNIVSNLGTTGKFEIVDSDTNEVLMNNEDIKKSNVMYGSNSNSKTASSSGTIVYLNIEFTKDGAKKLEDISEKYTNTTGNTTNTTNTETNEENNSTTTDSTSSTAKKITMKIDDETIMSTSFDETLKTGKLQLSVGSSSTDAKTIQGYIAQAQSMATVLDSGNMPVKYSVDENQYVLSDITKNDINTVFYVMSGIVAIALIVLVIKYKMQGLLGAISYIGLVAIFSLILRYTNVVITIEGIAGIAITLIMSYVFINKLLAKLKGKELNKTIINSAIKETYKEFFIAIIPIIIASITFSFISWEPISSFGMVMFWGIVLIAAYNISISNLLLKLKASNK